MDTICALATPMGVAAIGVIKISGNDTLEIVRRCFSPAKGMPDISEAKGYSLLYGWWKHPESGETIDDVVLAIFRAPHSYTGENVVEISCHGSTFILQEVMKSLVAAGCRMAKAGEFTRRAFTAGKMDLSQAEAVADLISSRTRSSARMALTQMRGGFRKKIDSIRERLLHFCALMELELDFPEEDVEFADRSELITLCIREKEVLKSLADSFARGAVIKNGVPVAIAGSTNAGKSSLLNLLLGEDKAIVTEIHGTTRDTIEDCIVLDGREFRLIDTAGIRKTTDMVEEIGIQRSLSAIERSEIVLWVIDGSRPNDAIKQEHNELSAYWDSKYVIAIINKKDMLTPAMVIEKTQLLESLPAHPDDIISISARDISDAELITDKLTTSYNKMYGEVETDDLIVCNVRHYEALTNATKTLDKVLQGLQSGLSGELVSMDIKETLQYLSEITGEISSTSVLHHIFAHFCIGK